MWYCLNEDYYTPACMKKEEEKSGGKKSFRTKETHDDLSGVVYASTLSTKKQMLRLELIINYYKYGRKHTHDSTTECSKKCS